MPGQTHSAAQAPTSAAIPSTEPTHALPTPAQLKPTTLTAPRFNLDEEALYKATFVFTQAEGEALEDLKIQLKRDLDTKINKYDLIRAALHLLVEEYAANGERSYVFRMLRRRSRR